MAVDIQGVEKADKYILTDPAVHCADFRDKFGDANRAEKGMVEFFESHRCNSVCTALSLPVHSASKKKI